MATIVNKQAQQRNAQSKLISLAIEQTKTAIIPITEIVKNFIDPKSFVRPLPNKQNLPYYIKNADALYAKATDSSISKKDKDTYAKQACEMLEVCLRIQPDKLRWFQLGQLYFQMENYEKAAPPYAESIKLGKNQAFIKDKLAHCYMSIGNSLLHKQNFLEASKYFKITLPLLTNNNTNLPTRLRCHKYLADSLFKINDFSESIAQYHECMQLNHPNLSSIPYNIAMCYMRIGNNLLIDHKFLAASCNYQRCLEFLPPTDKHVSVVHNNIASCYSSMSNNEKAIEHLDQAIKINPNSAPAYLNKAQILIKLKDYPKAQESFDQATCLESSLSNASIYMRIGNDLERLKKEVNPPEEKGPAKQSKQTHKSKIKSGSRNSGFACKTHLHTSANKSVKLIGL